MVDEGDFYMFLGMKLNLAFPFTQDVIELVLLQLFDIFIVTRNCLFIVFEGDKTSIFDISNVGLIETRT